MWFWLRHWFAPEPELENCFNEVGEWDEYGDSQWSQDFWHDAKVSLRRAIVFEQKCFYTTNPPVSTDPKTRENCLILPRQSWRWQGQLPVRHSGVPSSRDDCFDLSKVAVWADRGPVFCCQDPPHQHNHMAGAQGLWWFYFLVTAGDSTWTCIDDLMIYIDMCIYTWNFHCNINMCTLKKMLVW